MALPRSVPRRSGWLLVVAAAALLFAFDPAMWAFFPRCPLHALTGLLCPGCGAQRAVHALLHADFAGAFGHNALLVAALPLLGYIGLHQKLQPAGTRRAFYRRPVWVAFLAVVALAFCVLRNLDAFAFLAPTA